MRSKAILVWGTERRWEILSLFLATAVYAFIKFCGPLWVAHNYSNGKVDLLNYLSTYKGTESLDFYQGKLQEVLWGPLAQTISFSILAFLLCRYFRDISLRGFALIIFLFLCLTKPEVFCFPPYGDAIGGPFAEGLWLYQHHFDYAGLFHEPNFTVGGPRVYFFSLYPGFLALTLKLIPWTNFFLAFHHILTFALTAGIAAISRECGRKVFEPVLSILITLIVLALPLFQSQSEAINMEMPVAFFTLWSAFALIERKWVEGTILACLAAAIKGIGVVACLTAVIVMAFQIFRSSPIKEKLKLSFLTLGTSGFALFIVGAKFLFHDSHVQQGMVQLDAGWPSLQKEFIFYIFLISVFIFIFRLFKSGRSTFKDQLLAPAVIFLSGAGWFLLFLNFYAVSPRYRVTLYPFLVFSVVYGVTFVLKWKWFNRFIAVIVLGASCWLSYGSFYGSVPENDHVLLERSLEYRNDLELNRRLVKAAEERYSDHLIVAPFTIAQALAIPELGYVHKKLNVMIYGFGIKYGNIANYPGLKYLNLAKTVFIGVKVAPINPDFSYPVGPRDFVLEEIAVGNKKGSFFMGGYSIEALWRFAHGMNFK